MHHSSVLKSTLYASALLLASALPLEAREIHASSPSREGMDPQRLERITQLMSGEVDKGIMVGGMGMIARNGKVVYAKSFGMADREAQRPMEHDAIYRIYSMTKPVTTVALMMLYEEGRFFLNDPVAKYLPELADLEVALSTASGAGGTSDGTSEFGSGESDDALVGATRPAQRQPTVRDLMRHTAGMTYGVFGNTEVDQAYRSEGLWEAATLEAFVNILGTLPLQYDPGSRWHYSVSVDVQARLIEVLSGMRFSEFLKERLFKPLNMPDTSFTITPGNLPRLAQLYAPQGTRTGNTEWQRNTATQLEVADASVSASYMPGATFESGGGGLLSTARDYLRFAQMLLNGGELEGNRILSPKTVELMTINNLVDLQEGQARKGYGFGLGFGVLVDPVAMGELGSAGVFTWGGAAGTRFWVDPVEQLIGLFMVQSIPHQTRLGDQFRVLTYQAIKESYAP